MKIAYCPQVICHFVLVSHESSLRLMQDLCKKQFNILAL